MSARLAPLLSFAVPLVCLGLPLLLALLCSRQRLSFFVWVVINAAVGAVYLNEVAAWASCMVAVAVASAAALLARGGAIAGAPRGMTALGAAGALPLALRLAAEYAVPSPAGIALRYPLPGTGVVVAGGATPWANGHVAVPAQRWALDLRRPLALGDVVAGVAGDAAGMSSFGVPVLAPCDGVVGAVRDGLPDLSLGSVDVAHSAGNCVRLRCQNTSPPAEILLAHLRRGSVRVAPGATLAAGATLGEVGNSGNTATPHLHIEAHVADGNAHATAPLGGAALPIWFQGRFLRRLDRFEGPAGPAG